MAVKIFSVELPNSLHNQKTEQQRQGLITEFQSLINDFIIAHPNTTTTWLQSSGASSYAGSFTQLTAIIITF